MLHPLRPAAVLLAACVLSAGCGGGPNLATVRGVVLLDDKPLSTGTVNFIPADGGPAASGEISADGSFELQTKDVGRGALVGKHRVAVVAFKSATWPPNYDQTDGQQDSGALVPAHYGIADSSGISFEVEPGQNEFTIELSSN